ncbi:MAG: hypothetical protein U5N86_11745 [Planctomycetota bacterium]|nr:hypothetical protein [Planctomycetota bacterium]
MVIAFPFVLSFRCYVTAPRITRPDALSGLQNSVQVGKPLTMFLRRSTGEMKFRVTYPSGDIELQPVLRDDGFYVEAPAPAEPGFGGFTNLPPPPSRAS